MIILFKYLASAATAFLMIGPAAISEQAELEAPRMFQTCTACHTLGENEPNLAGPRLYKFCERKIGKVEGFSYSPAMTNEDRFWTAELLSEFLEKPRTVMPGTRMMVPSIRKQEDRDDIVAYLFAATNCD